MKNTSKCKLIAGGNEFLMCAIPVIRGQNPIAQQSYLYSIYLSAVRQIRAIRVIRG